MFRAHNPHKTPRRRNPLIPTCPSGQEPPKRRHGRAGLTCIGRLLAMVKLGMGGSALYVFVSAVSVLPNMEPDVKEETIIE